MNAGYGLTVRWSLENAPNDARRPAARLRRRHLDRAVHVPRRPGLQGLADARGEWFEGTYVFDSEQDRTVFREGFEPGAANAPGSTIIGSSPVLLEDWEVVAIAEGPAGFRRGAGPDVS